MNYFDRVKIVNTNSIWDGKEGIVKTSMTTLLQSWLTLSLKRIKKLDKNLILKT